MPAPKVTDAVTLPKVQLKDLDIPLEVLSIIPRESVEKYQVAAFAVDDSTVKLAIVHPEQLKQGFQIALKDLGRRVGKGVALFQTDPQSMRLLLKRYRTLQEKGVQALPPVPLPSMSAIPPSPPVLSDSHLKVPDPPLFELGKTVAFNYLKKVPLEFAKQHRLVCVDFQAPTTYWFLTDEAHKAQTFALLPSLEHQNHITAHLLMVKAGELDDLLEYYVRLAKDEAERQRVEQAATTAENEQRTKEQEREEHEKSIQKQMSAPEEEKYKEVKVAKGVVIPDAQGEIISSEEEKGGLAGLLQKVSQSLGSSHGDKPSKSEEETPSIAPSPVPAAAVGAAPTVAPSPVPAPSTTPSAPPTATAPNTSPKNKDDGDTEIGKLLSKPVESSEELKVLIRKGFIPQIVAAVVSFAIHEKASDIHLEAFDDEVRVRYRVDGQLVDIVKLPPDIHSAMVSRIKILSRLRLDETRVPQDGRFDVSFNDTQVDLRVSLMPTVHGEKVVMRILDKSKGVSSLENLGIEGLGYDNLIKAINRPFGICLATGPTGSGKSTSLYAILNRIATPNVNVVTLEDPVEYEMKGINQSQIRPKIGFTFAEGLRAILRQDPNIIMVGEIRDGETATMATQAALTGHLVLSTLHTNDAAGAIPRLTNMGIEPFLITSSLNVAVGQRLVRKICPECKSPVSLPAGIKDQISKELEQIAKISPSDAKRVKGVPSFFQGKGCPACRGKGYQGRMGIYEVLSMSEAVEDLALKRASGTDIQEQAQKEGMITMYQDGLLKVVAGLTTLDEVLRETSNK